jgi:hypothetical protein
VAALDDRVNLSRRTATAILTPSAVLLLDDGSAVVVSAARRAQELTASPC